LLKSQPVKTGTFSITSAALSFAGIFLFFYAGAQPGAQQDSIREIVKKIKGSVKS
jgi:hypothetical protein